MRQCVAYIVTTMRIILLRPGRGVECCDQSVCVCVSVREHISGTAGPIFTNFLLKSSVAVARSSSSSVAIRYVLPVSWMTSRLSVMGRMAYFNTGGGV